MQKPENKLESNKTATSRTGFGATLRKDRWWAQPLSVALALGLFGIYSTWAAFQGQNYLAEPYLSPFYSPLFLLDWWPFSPAILILWAPLGFRATCYYYRKAYYRAYFMDPPACSVGEFGEARYRGETAFPLILQNLHRYFLYFAIVVLVFLWADVFHAFFFDGKFGMRMGTLVLLANTSLLSLYTFSCHSLRHLLGGKLDCFSCSKVARVQHKTWTVLSALNRHHMLWAWTSLVSVGSADLYVRLVASGLIRDIRFF